MERTFSFKTKALCVFSRFLWNAKLCLMWLTKRWGEKKIAIVREMKLQNTQYCKVGYFPSHTAKATSLL